MSWSSKTSRLGSVTRASELGQYAYCARSWWLAQVQGVRPTNIDALERGTARHRQHGRQVLAYHRLQGLGLVLLLAAVALALLALWMLARG